MIKKKRVFQLFVILTGIFLTSCSKDDVIKYNDEYQGGIVFYVFQEGDVGYIPGETHGLIVSFEDLQTSTGESEVSWGCCSEQDENNCLEISEVQAWGGLGFGKADTEAILNACDEIDIAARLCDEYSIEYNGVVYDDWYLPSFSEVSYMDADSDYIDQNAIYWSSSQDGSDFATAAYAYSDSCGGDHPEKACWHMRYTGEYKYSKYKVKAVRSF